MKDSACALAKPRNSVHQLACCAEPGRRNGRRAVSSTLSIPCRIATRTGCRLSAMRSTVTTQTWWSMYRLPTTTAMDKKPKANSTKAASNSHTKYTCKAAIVPSTHHIHFRLLSWFFILSLVTRALERYPPLYLPGNCFHFTLDAAPARKGMSAAPVPFDTIGPQKSDGTEVTFLTRNPTHSTRPTQIETL